MQAAGLSPKSVRTDVGTLQAVFGAAVDSDLLARSPVRPRTLGLRPARKPERPTLTAQELLRLAGAVPPRYRALVLLAGTVGLRWGEAIGLRVGDLDFVRRRVSIRQTVEEVSGHVRVVEATKSEAWRRTFALPAFLVDELAAMSLGIARRPAATISCSSAREVGFSAAASRLASSVPRSKPPASRRRSPSTGSATSPRR